MFPLLIILSVARALSASSEKCPNVKGVDNVEMCTLGSGVWHQIARYPNEFTNAEKCISLVYTCKDEVIHLEPVYIPKESAEYYEANMTRGFASHDNGKLTTYISYGKPKTTHMFPLTVLSVDYDHYVIYYSCFFDEKKKTYQNLVWIYSRTKVLEGNIKSVVYDYIESSKILDYKKFIWIDNSEESCKTLA